MIDLKQSTYKGDVELLDPGRACIILCSSMMKNYRTLWAVVFSTCYALNTQADWKQWRGPAGQGHAEGKIPTEWSETQNISWKTPVPGKGWSSPVIEGNQIWLTAAHEIKASEEEKEERLKSNTGGQPVVVLSSVKLHAVCIDKDSGKLLHDFEITHNGRTNSIATPPLLQSSKVENFTATLVLTERHAWIPERQRSSGAIRTYTSITKTGREVHRSSGMIN